MRILVTGSTGFIGRHLVAHLAAEGHEVLSLSRSETGPAAAKTHVRHDFDSAAAIPDLGPLDAVAHLAAASSVLAGQEDPARTPRVNIQGTLAALLCARQAGARFLLASSQRVYRMGPIALREEDLKVPVDLYGYTKLGAELQVEMAARIFGVPAVVVRPFSVYGPGQLISRGTSGIVSIFVQRALSGEPMRVLSRHPKDFVHVADVVEGMARALTACQSPPRSYNIATGVPTTPLALAHAIQRVTGGASPILEDYSSEEPGGLVANIDRARRELGYEPRIRLEEGLNTYVSWLSRAQR